MSYTKIRRVILKDRQIQRAYNFGDGTITVFLSGDPESELYSPFALYKTFKGLKSQFEMGDRFSMKIYNDANVIIDEGDIELNGKPFNQYWQDLYLNRFLLKSPNVPIWDGVKNPRMEITKYNVGVKSPIPIQFFKKSNNNDCFIHPIDIWAEGLKSKKTRESYLNKIRGKQLKAGYKNGLLQKYKYGVPTTDIQSICDSLKIAFKIYNVVNEKLYEFRCEGKPKKVFEYYNTSLNHVETNISQKNIWNKDGEKIILPRNELTQLFNKCVRDKEDFLWGENLKGKITSLNFEGGTYRTLEEHEYYDIVSKWYKETGQKEAMYNRYAEPELDNFVGNSLLTSGTVDFTNTEIYKNRLNELQHLDQIKSYTNYTNNKYYRGFMGKITNLMKCDNEIYKHNEKQGFNGLYMIKNLDFSEIPEFFEIVIKSNSYKDYNIYSSPDLDFLKSYNVKFDIIGCCIGDKLDIKYNDDMMSKKIDGLAYYKKEFGCSLSNRDYNSFYQLGTKEYFNTIVPNTPFNDKLNRGVHRVKKTKDYTKKHISSYILAYQRLAMFEKMISLQKQGLEIIRVCVDGLYYIGDKIEIDATSWKYKDSEKTLNNSAGKNYLSTLNNKDSLKLQQFIDIFEFMGECEKIYRVNEYDGEGGTGKTTALLNKKGYVNKVYLTHSWLLSNQQSNNKIDNSVHYYLYNDCRNNKMRDLKTYSNYYIDEKSMLTEEMKKVCLRRFRGNLYFIGDRHQLPPITFCDGAKPFQNGKLIDNYVCMENTFETNYRIQCPKLYNFLKHLRGIMDRIEKGEIIKFKRPCMNELIENINMNELYKKYDYKEDTILSPFKINEELTNKIIENTGNRKYRINNNVGNGLYNGSIVYEKPNYPNTLTHTNTIHEVQGLTFSKKIFIYKYDDITSYKMIYTLFSRGHHLSQFVKIIS